MNALFELIALIFAGWRDADLKPVPPNATPEPDPFPPVPPDPVPAEPEEPEQYELPDMPEPVLPEEDYGPATLIAKAMEAKGYEIFDNNEKDYNLNIVGVRDTGARLDEFACTMNAFWKTPAGLWKRIEWKCTTYPGRRYLVERLLNPKGAAILCPGQYDVYRLDTHNGKYRALCQRSGPVRVYRDGDRDTEFDLNPSSVMSGMFGINLHAPVTPTSSTKNYIAQRVYAASAGCQVFASVADFLEFRSLCEKAADTWGNSFTYTLMDDTDLHEIDINLPEAPPPADSFDDLTTWNPTGDTVGVRHKNLLNVKGTDWKYSLGNDSRGHNRFPSYAKGLRAGIITLRSYWTRHQKRTIADILSRWAPASDTIGSLPGAPPNSPRDYSLFVSRRMGHHPTAPLSLFHEDGSLNDEGQLFDLVSAMAAYENYAGLELPKEVFREALRLV